MNKPTEDEKNINNLSIEDIQTMIIGSKERYLLLNIFNNLINSVNQLKEQNDKHEKSIKELGEKIAKDNNIP